LPRLRPCWSADKAPRGADAIKDVLVGTILWVTWPAIVKLAPIASAIGLSISYKSDLATGPTIVCSYGLVLLAAGLERRLTPERVAVA
jgi:ABC-type Mn2+/Zn2+ transport system permease subunit